MTEKQKKSMLIGSLLAVVVLMAIAYSAFASNLTITGTGSVSSNWCIGFDSTRTSDYTATAGISGGTVPTGSMAFSGDACGSNYKTTASLNASFKQPGDKIEYTLTIGNKGTLAAAIESINVDGSSVTSDTTITKGNIKYIIEMPESTSLAVNATTTMKVAAMFQNDTEVSGSGNEQQTISISINAIQDDGNGGFTPTPTSFTGTIYRNNTNIVQIGAPLEGGTAHRYCSEGSNGQTTVKYKCTFSSLSQCQENLSNGQDCVEDTVESNGVGQYETNPYTFINNNIYYFLKHEVENNIVKTQEVCYYTSGEIYCLPEEWVKNSYEDIVKSFNNGIYTFSNNNCSQGMGNLSCWDEYITVIKNGSEQHRVADRNSNFECYIHEKGYSNCHQN